MVSNDGSGSHAMTNGQPSQALKIDGTKTSSSFVVVVTAMDGKTTNTYTIEVTLTMSDTEELARFGSKQEHQEAPSGLFVLTTTVSTDDDPTDERWLSLLIIPSFLLVWGLFLLFAAVTRRLSRGRRPQHRGLINGPAPSQANFGAAATLVDPSAVLGVGGTADDVGSVGVRLAAIACPATDRRRLRSLDALRGLALCG